MAHISILQSRHRRTRSAPRVPSLSAHSVEALRRAVASGRIGVTYEAILELATGDWVAWGARPSWRHPSFGWIRPEAFVPSAAREGFGEDLDWVLLRRVLADVAGWSRHGSSPEMVFVALQPATLGMTGAADQIAELIASDGLLGRVGVEVPDPWLSSADGLRAATRLADRGVQMAVNQFQNRRTVVEAARMIGAEYLKVEPDGRANGGRGWSLASLQAILGPVSELGTRLVAHGLETRGSCHPSAGLLMA